MQHYDDWKPNEVPDHVQAEADDQGVFEVNVEDFAAILDKSGVGYFDTDKGTLRVLAEPFARALIRLQIDTTDQLAARSLSLRREEQIA